MGIQIDKEGRITTVATMTGPLGRDRSMEITTQTTVSTAGIHVQSSTRWFQTHLHFTPEDLVTVIRHALDQPIDVEKIKERRQKFRDLSDEELAAWVTFGLWLVG